jgi:hypothetical protein
MRLPTGSTDIYPNRPRTRPPLDGVADVAPYFKNNAINECRRATATPVTSDRLADSKRL